MAKVLVHFTYVEKREMEIEVKKGEDADEVFTKSVENCPDSIQDVSYLKDGYVSKDLWYEEIEWDDEEEE